MLLMRPVPYRVRVWLSTESWVEVDAISKEEAEKIAATLYSVTKVFPGSAVRADEFDVPERAPGVSE
jgi:hypothetical protein